MQQTRVPGAIVGIWGPQGRYVRAFGVADKDTREPMRTDLYSRIGSVTKTFTVTAVLQLADAGKLGLDDPISKFVAGVPRGERITLRQLARMQSGLPNYSAAPAFQRAVSSNPHRHFTPRELLDWAFTQTAALPPGVLFEYNNTNAVLLGLVVERVSGLPLPSYLRNRILTPLSMSHTGFPVDATFPRPHAQGYTTQTADGAEATATDWNPSWAWAAGAMISTADDMRVWAPALAKGALLSPAMQRQRLETVGSPGLPPQDGYGLGLFDVAGWIGHNGSLPGYQSVVVYLPQRDITLVILLNTDTESDAIGPGTALATAITQRLTPDHVYTLSLGTPATFTPKPR